MNAIIGLVLKLFTDIFSDVFKDVLKTPAEETVIEDLDNDFILPDTPVTELLSRGEVKS